MSNELFEVLFFFCEEHHIYLVSGIGEEFKVP